VTGIRISALVLASVALVLSLQSGVAENEVLRPRESLLDVIDPLWPPGHSAIIRIRGTMGEPFSKELIVENYSPYLLEDVVLKLGLAVEERFPQTRLRREVLGPVPDDWVLEPSELEIGALPPGENRSVRISGRISRVGTYFILLAATARIDEGGVQQVLWYNVELVLEPAGGGRGATVPLWLIAGGLLGACAVVFAAKKRGPVA